MSNLLVFQFEGREVRLAIAIYLQQRLVSYMLNVTDYKHLLNLKLSIRF
ncbi:hypothetical protein [Aulosira sp. FACHB-615]|nr:hypothetical protein [Aulosira sp. FACHB-615]MBD2491946.1 hypothetical protein [Aulosira sp. FACHB-615]